jgi:hypothetical protein
MERKEGDPEVYIHGTGKIKCSFMRILLFSPQFLHVKNFSSSAVRWALGWGNLLQARRTLRHDTTTTMPGPCSESVPPLGGEGALRPQALRSGANLGRVGVDTRSCFSLGWQVTRVPPYVRLPFPSKENRQISERDDLGPPVVPRGQEIGLGSRHLRPGEGASHGARHL